MSGFGKPVTRGQSTIDRKDSGEIVPRRQAWTIQNLQPFLLILGDITPSSRRHGEKQQRPKKRLSATFLGRGIPRNETTTRARKQGPTRAGSADDQCEFYF
ncbi:hypothetical protein BaRGS_00033709 [Batillaria attramentaria]|uniref:Uncharacterized protein n=1 Tax=Batillaria attramentaria TaxID=370345 RepID=A0ABD0JJ68_9CAEN